MRHAGSRQYSIVPLLTLLVLAAACGDQLTGPDPSETPRLSPAPSNPLAALQATPPGYVRIGVVPSATAIAIGAPGGFAVLDKATGDTLFAASGSAVPVELLTAGSVDTRLWLQTACASEAARDDWLARAGALGYETRTEFVPAANCWRLRLGTMNQGFNDRTAFKTQAIADGLAAADAFWTTVTIVHDEAQVRVSHDGVSHTLTGPARLVSDDGVVTIAGNSYRGVAEVWTNSGGTLAGINELPLEEYLYGVVPRELPPGPYGLPEAQKAQAVTARTYALANLGKRSADGYDLLPTTSDQVYGGFGAEHPVSTAAVDETAGVVAVYQGTLITTLYHSTSGGFTANAEDVYSSVVAYLRGVPDQERGSSLEYANLQAFKRHANPRNLRAGAEGDLESDWSVYHRWVVNWTDAEMAEVLAASLGRPIAEVLDIRVTDRADHGRVREIEFVTDVGTFVARKDGIRSVLRYLDAAGNHASLRSTLFFLERQDGGWVAYGGGWGHGVGMSQTGAVGMALKGRSYEEILKHYYRGIELEVRN